MACKDYLTVDQLKAMPGYDPGTATDAGLAFLIMAASDWIDKEILGHTYNRAIRIYEDNDDSTAATVQVTSTSVIVVITGGANAGTYPYTFADYDELADLVAAMNENNVHATLLGEGFTDWMSSQPSTNLAVAATQSIHNIENWKVLCLTQLTMTLSGGGDPYLFLPLKIRTVNGVNVEGTDLTAGDDYYIKKGGYLIKRGCRGYSDILGVCSTTACICHKPGCWACAYPCNVVVSFIPLVWTPQYHLLASAITQFIANFTVSGGFVSERIGRYSYKLGEDSFTMMGILLSPLQGEGLAMYAFP